MAKPGHRKDKPSDEIAGFTGRQDERRVFQFHLTSPTEPPVLMFYGIGGAGKTWLLRKLLQETPADVPTAYLDFDTRVGGQRFVNDPTTALYDIRQQLGTSAPRFDLAYAMLRYKQGVASEPERTAVSLAAELIAEVAQAAQVVPGVNVLLNKLSPRLLARLKGSNLERFLARNEAARLVLDLRTRTSQQVGSELLHYLAADLRENLKSHLDKAVRAVIFFDSFEAIATGLQTGEHRRFREQWIRELAANFDVGLTVIAGQNRLDWHEAEPAWADNLRQHLVGGLSERDACLFLANRKIDDAALQGVILASAREADSGRYHCFSLSLCADIVYAERRSGREPKPERLRLGPQDLEMLARRFLKSLSSDAERRWIERLALTPRFDELAGRTAFSHECGTAQDAEWEGLSDYSFVQPLHGMTGWYAIRVQMRWALENQPSAQERVAADHCWWQDYWSARKTSAQDDASSLAWYHSYCLKPAEALAEWKILAEAARETVPPRMDEHFRLLDWWEPVGLLKSPLSSAEAARACDLLGAELWETSLGDRTINLRRAIEYLEGALHFRTENHFPRDWAETQGNLGAAWRDLPTGNRAANVKQAIKCFEAALRVYTEQDFPREWVRTQNDLGIAWWSLPTGDRNANLNRAVEYYEAALRVCTEQDFPRFWAKLQNNLGTVLDDLQTGDREANLRRAIECYEAALRIRTEQDFPQQWARTQNNLGNVWLDLETGDREANLRRAMECYEAALRIRTEQDFPQQWATTQHNLGEALMKLSFGDRAENLLRAIQCGEAALRVYTEHGFPQYWARTQHNLGNAWKDRPGDLASHRRRAIECYEAALRVRTEQDFPLEHAETAANLKLARKSLDGLCQNLGSGGKEE